MRRLFGKQEIRAGNIVADVGTDVAYLRFDGKYVSYNFLNRVNFGDYLADLLQRLPAMMRGPRNVP
jgi:hypothetical protein